MIIQVATYSSGSPLSWRETDNLPSPTDSLRAAVVNNILYVTGGYNGDPLSTILSWNPSEESWTEVGNLKVARYYHAVVAVPDLPSTMKCL